MKRFEVKTENGETLSTRNSIEFARSDANKVKGATIHKVVPVMAEGKVKYTWKFPTS